MKTAQDHDQELEQWANHRREHSDANSEFTRGVMERIRIEAAAPTPRDLPVPRLQQITLAAACATAGIGKFLILVHFAI
jgi:hypothetical protein